jgi:hypothetical protein
MNGKVEVYLTTGRWQSGTDTRTIDGLDDESLIKAAEARIKENGGVGPSLHMSTQILIWEGHQTSRNHNLIAVYAIREKKLTTL